MLVRSEDVHREIERACELAPLHDPPNLHGIDAAMKTFSDVPHVSVVCDKAGKTRLGVQRAAVRDPWLSWLSWR